ncbi:MAG: HEPN domain-containing protein [Acidiferrobacter sp.]
MANAKLWEEASEWMAEAKHDLATAQSMLSLKNYAWTCFAAQQAAEKAFKAILIGADSPAIKKHAIADLSESVQDMVQDLLPEVVREASGLDIFYIASRYPDAAPGKRAPFRVITQHQADDAVRIALGAVTYLDDILTRFSAPGSATPDTRLF